MDRERPKGVCPKDSNHETRLISGCEARVAIYICLTQADMHEHTFLKLNVSNDLGAIALRGFVKVPPDVIYPWKDKFDFNERYNGATITMTYLLHNGNGYVAVAQIDPEGWTKVYDTPFVEDFRQAFGNYFFDHAPISSK